MDGIAGLIIAIIGIIITVIVVANAHRRMAVDPHGLVTRVTRAR